MLTYCWMGFEGQAINLLCVLETVSLLLAGGPDAKPGKDANIVANQTLFSQVILTPMSLRKTFSSSSLRHRTLNLFGLQRSLSYTFPRMLLLENRVENIL